MLASTALYGPQAAALVELFPTSIRYTALSVPYNIGTGWIGGLLPVSAFAIVAATGDIYSGLFYPFVFTAISLRVLLAVAAGDIGSSAATNRRGPCRIGVNGRVVRRWGRSERQSCCRYCERVGRPTPAGGRNIIDVHAHYQPPAIRALNLPGPMNAWDLQKQIDDMDAAGVTRAVLSITTPGCSRNR